MIIKRHSPPRIGGRTKAKTFVLASVAVLTMSSVSSVEARYQQVPGYRGTSVTLKLAPPKPLATSDAALFGFSAPLTPDAADPYGAVPMPEFAPTADLALPATPPANLSAVPFVLPTTVNTGAAAMPYIFASRNPTDSLRAAICLTTAIYYEAASESDDGQRAVAQVILNRVRHPAWPNTVCGVVYQGSDRPGCQFSFACDGSMARHPSAAGWLRASRIARHALAGYAYAPVGLATFYHTPQVNPSWNRRLITTSILGNHIFYRMPGAQGVPSSFSDRYAGGEPTPAPKPRAYVPPKPIVAGPGMAGLAPYPGAMAPTPAVPLPQAGAEPVPMPTATPYQRLAKPRVEEDNRYVRGTLPESDVMPAYRDSGTWIGR